VSGQFSAPDGVDPTQPTQLLPVTDLTVSRGANQFYTAQNAMAQYANGTLVGVTGVVQLVSNDVVQDQINLNGTLAVDGGYSGVLALDGADTQLTFQLVDASGTPTGYNGAVSYQIPTSQIDPTQASQTLTLSTFNLNIGGTNFTYSPSSPQLMYSYGDLQGVNVPTNTALPVLPYNSIILNGFNTQGVPIAAPIPQPVQDETAQMVILDFSKVTTGQAYDLKMGFGTDAKTNGFTQVTASVQANWTTAQIANGVADAITSMDGKPYKVYVDGSKITIVAKKGPATWQDFSIQATGGATRPDVLKAYGKVITSPGPE
jgi:hypothetical protein